MALLIVLWVVVIISVNRPHVWVAHVSRWMYQWNLVTWRRARFAEWKQFIYSLSWKNPTPYGKNMWKNSHWNELPYMPNVYTAAHNVFPCVIYVVTVMVNVYMVTSLLVSFISNPCFMKGGRCHKAIKSLDKKSMSKDKQIISQTPTTD